jgi:glutathione S-transferase
MKLEYFPIHGRAIQIRLLLAYCKVDYEDIFVTLPEFAQRKKQGDFAPSGQLPMLTLNDGTKLFQTKSILRYIAKTQKGKNGENLYPGHSDPLLSFKIDEVIDTREDFLNNNL